MKQKKTALVDELVDRGGYYSPPIISRRSAVRRKNLILFVFIFYFSILGCFLIEKKYSLRSFIINGGSSSAGEFGGGNNSNNRIEFTTSTKIKANVTTTTLVFGGVDEEINKVAVGLPSSTNTASAAAASSSSLNSNEIKQQQIENYRQGKGLMLNMHPVHHAGTTFCGTIGRNGINGDVSPNFACLHDKEHRIPGYEEQKYLFGIKPPWTYDEMNIYLEQARQYFHMISWEFNSIDDIDTIVRPLKQTNWEHPKLLSIVITRDPLSRLLAGSAMTKRKYTGYNTGNMLHERWWDYIAKDYNKNTDNFFLRMIGNYPRTINNKNEHENSNNNKTRNKNRNMNRNLSKTDRIGRLTKKDLIIIEKEMAIKKQNETFVSKSVKDMLQLYPSYITKSDYDFAVQQLNRYTIVLDIQCLNDGIIELSKLLGLNTTNIISKLTKKQQTSGTTFSSTNSDTNSNTNGTTTNTRNKGKHSTTRQRIGYDDVYQYLVEKNYWDIKLYEYSKNISLVRC